MRAVPLLLAVLATASAMPSADAYVQNRTSTGTALAWGKACRNIRLAGEAHDTIDHATLSAALDRSLMAWRASTSSCARLDAQLDRSEAAATDVAYDGENVILWRDAAFCAEAANADRDVCAAPQAAAVTTLFFIDKPGDPRDGEILDVDIALNGIDFTFGTREGELDLESVLSHEIGHYLGLGHVCHTDRASDPLPAGDGTVTPHCYPLVQLDRGLKQATMFNFIEPGETLKRDPEEDEWRGVCAIYSQHDGDCDPAIRPTGCGGCMSGPGAGAASILVIFAMAPILLSRRRK